MITILCPGIGLLCRRTNDAPEFVKNCWSDVEKEAPHLRNPYDFALGMELRGYFRQSPACLQSIDNTDLVAEQIIAALQVVFRSANDIREAVIETTKQEQSINSVEEDLLTNRQVVCYSLAAIIFSRNISYVVLGDLAYYPCHKRITTRSNPCIHRFRIPPSPLDTWLTTPVYRVQPDGSQVFFEFFLLGAV
jgi:hypothetical protein